LEFLIEEVSDSSSFSAFALGENTGVLFFGFAYEVKLISFASLAWNISTN